MLTPCLSLQEFAEFARSRDLADGKAQGFELPYAIEADKVHASPPAAGRVVTQLYHADTASHGARSTILLV